MFDLYVESNARCAHKTIAELNLDKEVLISSIVRGGKIIFPKGSTVIEPEDILYVLAHSASIGEIADRLNGV